MNKDFLSLKKGLKRGLGKKAMSTMLAGTLLFSSGALTTEANAYSLDEPETTYEEFLNYNGIKMFVNGRYVEFNDDMGYPILIDGTTFIPVRAVAEAFSAFVQYFSDTNTVYINKEKMYMAIPVGKKFIKFRPDETDSHSHLKEQTIEISKAAFIKNGRTYLPLRVIFEVFGAKVDWISETKTIIVNNDYSLNSKYIDFKGNNVFGINDIDLNKKYSKIIYDGCYIDMDYVKLLKTTDQYKVLEDDGKLYIFSNQYLMDINYIHSVYHNYKIDTMTHGSLYELRNLSDEAKRYACQLFGIDGYNSYFSYTFSEPDIFGYSIYFRSVGDENKYKEIDAIVDEVVSYVKSNAKTTEEMVTLTNDKLCELMKEWTLIYGPVAPINMGVYDSLVTGPSTCGGYVMTFKYVMDKLGIPCIEVSGVGKSDNIGHGWNEVLIDGEWKMVDVYWNDLGSTHRYLLMDIDDEYYNSRIMFDHDNLDREITKLTLYLGAD